MTGWHRGNDYEPHPEHPERPPAGRTAKHAINAAGGGLYTLYLLRWDDVTKPERYVAYLGGVGRGYGPDVAHVIDLMTGEEFEISNEDKSVEARKIRLTDLPGVVRESWMRDEHDQLIPARMNDQGGGMSRNLLREIAAGASAAASAPVQETLFG